MSKIKFEKAYAKKRITSFGGIREGVLKKVDGASDIRNLRIRPDGSLEKRNGWYSFRLFSKTIRGFWQGTVEEQHCIFLVSGTTIYRMFSDKTAAIAGTLTSTEGAVRFQRYQNRLYLFDGTSIYVLNFASQTFSVAKGYIPLYGHNWHPTELGDINEPANLLNQSLRIHYLNTTGTTTFLLPFFAASIDSLRVNNKNVYSYNFVTGSDSFTLSSALPGDIVEVAITISGSNAMQQQLHEITNSFLHRDGAHENLLLYGCPQGYRVFCSSEVTDIMLAYCSIAYPDCDPLYFKNNQMQLIGDIDHPVTAMTSNFDRILAFHTGGAYSITIDGDSIFSYPVLSDMGCSVQNGAVQIGNNSVIINERGICRLHSTSSDPDTFSIQNLSEQLDDKWSKSICQTGILFWDSAKQELWVRDTAESTEGLVWIWNAALNEWYCFDGIYASLFTFYKGQVLFVANNQLCRFDDNIYADGGKTFQAYYQSGYLTLDSVHSVKRSLRAAISASTNGTGLLLTLETERSSHVFTFEGKSVSSPEFFEVRLSPGRFRYLRYRITYASIKASTLHEINLFTTL